MLCSSTPTFCHGKLIDLFSISMRPQLEVEVQHQCRRQSPFEALQQHFSSIAFGFLFIWACAASQACARTTKEPKGAEARSAKLCTHSQGAEWLCASNHDASSKVGSDHDSD